MLRAWLLLNLGDTLACGSAYGYPLVLLADFAFLILRDLLCAKSGGVHCCPLSSVIPPFMFFIVCVHTELQQLFYPHCLNWFLRGEKSP